MFLCGVVRHAVISPYPSRRFIPPSAWRWVRPRDILGTRAAVPFVNKPLWFYASSPKTDITRNSEYLCVVLAICETKAQNGTARSSIALVCNVTCSLSLSVGCQYGTQRTNLVAAACRRYERHQLHPNAWAGFENRSVHTDHDAICTALLGIYLFLAYLTAALVSKIIWRQIRKWIIMWRGCGR